VIIGRQTSQPRQVDLLLRQVVSEGLQPLTLGEHLNPTAVDVSLRQQAYVVLL
jgi:hypothetical protein